MESARKVSKRIWIIRGKYLRYMKNMENCYYLRYTKSSPITRKVFKRIRRVRGKNLCVHEEDANTPKDIKVCISRLIIMEFKNFLDSFHIHYMG